MSAFAFQSARVAALALACGISAAHAAVISYDGREAFATAFQQARVQGFDELPAGSLLDAGRTVGGVTLSNASGVPLLVLAEGIASSGAQSLGDALLGVFVAGDEIRFDFATPQTAFAIDVITFSTVNGSFGAMLDGGELIDSTFDPIAGLGIGQFIGFSSDVPFTSVRLSGWVPYTLDTLRSVAVGADQPPALPLPGTAALAALGMLAAFACGAGQRTRPKARMPR